VRHASIWCTFRFLPDRWLTYIRALTCSLVRIRSNGFSCTCSAFWTGPTCAIDVNECATANAGCPYLCTNTAGGFLCNAYVVPGSLTAAAGTATTTLIPLVLASNLPGNQVQFTVNEMNMNARTLTYTLGPVSDPQRSNCTAISFSGTGASIVVTCTLSGSCGTANRVHAWQGTVLVAISLVTDVMSVAPPQPLANTIRSSGPKDVYPPSNNLQPGLSVAG
jgi:hypothetical protein